MSEDLSISLEDTARFGTVPIGRPRPGRLHEFFERACDETPDAVALECGTHRLTYRELEAHANRMAHVLIRRGIGPHARVGILVPRSVPMYVTLLAALKTGATFVPIDPAAPADRVAYVAADAALDLLVVTPELEAAARGAGCPVCGPATSAPSCARPPGRGCGRPATSRATSSTPPAPPAAPRASRSARRASATALMSSPVSTGFGGPTACTRA